MEDKVGVLSCGEMQQWDTPHAVYHHPTNTVVADFVGEGDRRGYARLCARLSGRAFFWFIRLERTFAII